MCPTLALIRSVVIKIFPVVTFLFQFHLCCFRNNYDEDLVPSLIMLCSLDPQPAYVVQIFPPCEFSESHLSRLAPDLLNSISSISPHLMIVIASV